jgi:hypothetical protein
MAVEACDRWSNNPYPILREHERKPPFGTRVRETAVSASVEGGPIEECVLTSYVFEREDHEQRAAAFVHSVLRRSFDDRNPAEAAREIWPPHDGSGRNHSAAIVYEGHLLLRYEAEGHTWERIVELLRLQGAYPPTDGHTRPGASLKKWLSNRRVALRKFRSEIERLGGTPPDWLGMSAHADRCASNTDG